MDHTNTCHDLFISRFVAEVNQLEIPTASLWSLRVGSDFDFLLVCWHWLMWERRPVTGVQYSNVLLGHYWDVSLFPHSSCLLPLVTPARLPQSPFPICPCVFFPSSLFLLLYSWKTEGLWQTSQALLDVRLSRSALKASGLLLVRSSTPDQIITTWWPIGRLIFPPLSILFLSSPLFILLMNGGESYMTVFTHTYTHSLVSSFNTLLIQWCLIWRKLTFPPLRHSRQI